MKNAADRILLFVAGCLLLVSATSSSASAAQSVSVQLQPGSSCGALTYEFGVTGDDIIGESVTVTDETMANVFSSDVQFDSVTLNGLTTRTIAPPVTADKVSGLLAVTYRFVSQRGGASTASFFSLVDCAQNVEIYTCLSNSSNCPSNISEFFPSVKLIRKSASLSNGGSITFPPRFVNGESHEAEIEISNSGKPTLQITKIWIDGEDARDFSIYYGVAPIASGESDYLEIEFQPKKRKAGIRRAVLHMLTNDPFNQEIRLSLSGRAKLAPDLSVALLQANLESRNGVPYITGQISIKNVGSKASKAGAEVSVGLWDRNTVKDTSGTSGYYYKKVHQKTFLKRSLPSLKPGGEITMKFQGSGAVQTPFVTDKFDTVIGIVRPVGKDISEINNWDHDPFMDTDL